MLSVIQPVCVAIKRIMLSVVMLSVAIKPMSFILSVSIKLIMLRKVMPSVTIELINLSVIYTERLN